MSVISCNCDDPSFGYLGRPTCVILQGPLSSVHFSPRYGTTGLRNFLPANAAGITLFNAQYGTTLTTLKECVDYRLDASTHPLNSLYPSPVVENATFARTETVYETAPSNRKVKIPGQGGIRTWAFELWGKDAAFGIARAVDKFGCDDLDVYYIDKPGNDWGIQDTVGDGVLRGYEMSTETFDSFIEYATDTTTVKIMLSFDLDAFECEQNAWCITAEEYEGKFTAIRPLIQGISSHDAAASTLVAASPIIISVSLSASFGTAGNKHDITGSLTGDFELLDDTGGIEEAAGAWASVVESPNGTYLLTTTVSPTAGTYTLTSKATGYIIPNVNVVVA